MSGLQIHAFPALKDNYAFLVRDAASGQVAAIDAPDAEAMIAALDKRGWTLDYILNTHWHPDHAGGNAALKTRYGCTIAGPEEVRRIAPLDRVLSGGERFTLGETVFDVLDLGGHTLGHIGYSAPSERVAFVGDTLFALGCGRLFEGTAAQMWDSLTRLMTLDDRTLIYCAHEYTLSNLTFAEHLGVFPALSARAADIRARRERGEPTVPARLADEIATNPFLVYPLREGERAAQAAKFAELRAAKDRF